MEDDVSLPQFLLKSTTVQVNKSKKSSKQTPKTKTPTILETYSDPFTMLNKDLAVNVLKFLDISEILKFSTVSKQWNALCYDETLWCFKYHYDFNLKMKSTKPHERRGKGSKKKKNPVEKENPSYWRNRYQTYQAAKINYQNEQKAKEIKARAKSFRQLLPKLKCDHDDKVSFKCIIDATKTSQTIHISCRCGAQFVGSFTCDPVPVLIHQTYSCYENSSSQLWF